MTSGYEIALGIQGAIAEMHRVRERELETELSRLRAENERLTRALQNIRYEAEREDGRISHLKRCIAVQTNEALAGEKE